MPSFVSVIAMAELGEAGSSVVKAWRVLGIHPEILQRVRGGRMQSGCRADCGQRARDHSRQLAARSHRACRVPSSERWPAEDGRGAGLWQERCAVAGKQPLVFIVQVSALVSLDFHSPLRLNLEALWTPASVTEWSWMLGVFCPAYKEGR